jgi:hypothetical protein
MICVDHHLPGRRSDARLISLHRSTSRALAIRSKVSNQPVPALVEKRTWNVVQDSQDRRWPNNSVG